MINDRIATNLLKQQREAFEKELNNIRDMKASKGKAAAIFYTKDKIVIKKAAPPEAVVVIDPETKY